MLKYVNGRISEIKKDPLFLLQLGSIVYFVAIAGNHKLLVSAPGVEGRLCSQIIMGFLPLLSIGQCINHITPPGRLVFKCQFYLF
jgi:hypothetical protein